MRGLCGRAINLSPTVYRSTTLGTPNGYLKRPRWVMDKISQGRRQHQPAAPPHPLRAVGGIRALPPLPLCRLNLTPLLGHSTKRLDTNGT
jgi:hypothetical protein